MSNLPLDTDLAARRPERELAAETAAGALGSLLPLVAAWVPGASDLEIRLALAETARDFCDRTNCWQVPAEWADLVRPMCPGHYALQVPEGAVALRLRENRRWIFGRGAYRWRGLPGPRPVFVWGRYEPPPPFLPIGRHDLAPMPMLSLAPAPGSEAFGEEPLARWGQAIADGALSRLLAMRDKPWGDKAGQHLAQRAVAYASAIVEARAESERLAQSGNPPGLGPLTSLPGIPFA